MGCLACFTGICTGSPHDNIWPVYALPRLLLARKYCAHSAQTDYLDDTNVIGWMRQGEGSAMAVVLTDGPGGSKTMCVGAEIAGKVFANLQENRQEHIPIPEDGMMEFPVSGSSLSVWVPENTVRQIAAELKIHEGSIS